MDNYHGGFIYIATLGFGNPKSHVSGAETWQEDKRKCCPISILVVTSMTAMGVIVFPEMTEPSIRKIKRGNELLARDKTALLSSLSASLQHLLVSG